jgi:hypothetical protein
MEVRQDFPVKYVKGCAIFFLRTRKFNKYQLILLQNFSFPSPFPRSPIEVKKDTSNNETEKDELREREGD